jgi:NADH:ubiquinone oxidoreductase subunit D
MSRSVGIQRDLRLGKLETYANYYFINFRAFIGQHGDSYDRFLIRINEMAESLNIINQVVYKLIKLETNKTHTHTITAHNLLKYTVPTQFNDKNFKNNYNSMETLINHFKY